MCLASSILEGVFKDRKNKLGLLLLAIATAVLTYIFISRSVIIVYDSTQDYLQILDAIANRPFGYEFMKLLGTEYAPMYVLYLAALKYLFSDLIVAYEIFSVILFFINGIIILKFFRNINDIVVRFGLTIIVLFFVQFVHVYLFMLSEGLMLTFILAYLYLKDFSSRESLGNIVLQNILIVLSFFVKYSSLVIIIGICLSEVLLRKTSFWVLIRNHVASWLIISIWLSFCYFQKGNITGDTFQYQRTFVDCIVELHVYLNKFILPFTYIPIIAFAIYTRLSLQWLVVLWVYLLFIVFFDFTGRLVLDERILIPVYLFLMLIIRDLYQFSTHILYKRGYSLFLTASVVFTLFRFVKNYLFWLNEY